MKTANLEGALLDYWVACAAGMAIISDPEESGPLVQIDGAPCPISQSGWHPSSDWARGGKIVERERITLISPAAKGDWWTGVIGYSHENGTFADLGKYVQYGPTPLVAAMRTYVYSVFGDEVPDKGGSKMKLWMLTPRNDLSSSDDPWRPSYGKSHGLIVRAENEVEARKLARDNAGDENSEGKDPWMSEKYSTCVEIKQDGEADVLMSRYQEF